MCKYMYIYKLLTLSITTGYKKIEIFYIHRLRKENLFCKR